MSVPQTGTDPPPERQGCPRRPASRCSRVCAPPTQAALTSSSCSPPRVSGCPTAASTPTRPTSTSRHCRRSTATSCWSAGSTVRPPRCSATGSWASGRPARSGGRAGGCGRAIAPHDDGVPLLSRARGRLVRGVDPGPAAGSVPGHDARRLGPKAAGFHLYTIVIGDQCLHAIGYAMGQRSRARWVRARTARRPSASSVTAPRPRATSPRRSCTRRSTTRRWSSSARTTSGRSPSPWSARLGCRCSSGRPATASPESASTATTCWPAEAVYAGALERARRGRTHAAVEAFTYRMGAHTTSDDPTRYRDDRPSRSTGSSKRPDRAGAGHISCASIADDRRDSSTGAGRGRRSSPLRSACTRAMPPAGRVHVLTTSTRTSPAGRPPERAELPWILPAPRGEWTTDGARSRWPRPSTPDSPPPWSDDPKVIVHRRGHRPARRGLPGHRRAAGATSARSACIDTPLAESGIIGTAVGLAMRGYRAGVRDPVRRVRLPGLRPDHHPGSRS